MLDAVFIIHYYNRLRAAGEFHFICPAELYSSSQSRSCFYAQQLQLIHYFLPLVASWKANVSQVVLANTFLSNDCD